MKSIRARLLAGLLGGVLLVLLAAAGVIYTAVRDEVTELFDYQLEQIAYQAAAQPATATGATSHRADAASRAAFVIRIWDRQGALLFQSRPASGLPPPQVSGFSTQQMQGEGWRMFDTTVDGRRVQVAQPLRAPLVEARDIVGRALLLFAPVFPLVAVLIWFTVGRGLRPLHRLSADVQRRSHRDLAPIDLAPLPREIAPLAVSLNDLMTRLGRVIKAQQTFVADAAHELLTPITALQLQAQLLSRAGDESSRQQALADLRAALTRTIRLAQQLLTLARQDADLQGLQMKPVGLPELARRVVAMQRPLAESKSVTVELRTAAAPAVSGAADALATLLANLLENAIKYTPVGGQVAVAVGPCQGGAEVVIEDSGPGIPEEARQRVFDRFYRRAGSGATGNGLGLAIVRDIAARHGAQVGLSTSARFGGLEVRVRFRA